MKAFRMAGTEQLQRERERSEDLVCHRTANHFSEVALSRVFPQGRLLINRGECLTDHLLACSALQTKLITFLRYAHFNASTCLDFFQG